MPDTPPLGRNRGFALLWAAEALATLGDKVLFVALAWLVLNLTGSSLAMGGLLLCFSLPGIAFLVMGGVASDRLPRRAVMVAADLLRGLMVLALAFVHLPRPGGPGPPVRRDRGPGAGQRLLLPGGGRPGA